jgi:hypothetical protein
MPDQFNYYDYTNHYGLRMFAIAAVNAMPRNYSSIIFTGTHEECMNLMNPQGLEGSVEDLQNKVAFRK